MIKRLAMHSTIVLVDVASFTDPDRTPAHQTAARAGLYRVLEQAFNEARIYWAACHHEDRGDGVMVLVPANVSPVVVADQFLDRLVAALREHNAVHRPEASIRLRLALHSGQVQLESAGAVGAALDDAFRLLAAPVAKQTLRETTGILAVVSSEKFYQDVISQTPATAPESYRRIHVEFRGFSSGAWLRLLGERTDVGSALHVIAPPAIAPGEPFQVEVRVLNTSTIVDAFTIDVSSFPASEIDDPHRVVSLYPQSDTTLRFEITAADADAVRAAGAPWRLAVRVRARAQEGKTEAVRTAHVQVLVPPTAPEFRSAARPPKPERRVLTARSRDGFHLLADHPVEREGDLLGADETARRIADVILSLEAATPFTLGVQGGWGTGKSSLMRLIRRYVETSTPGRKVRVVWFNAWTAKGSDALVALIRSVLYELDANILRRIVRRTRATSWLKLPFMVLGSWLGSRGLADEVWRLFALDAPRRNEIRTEIQQALGDWADRDRELRGGRLLVVFVDDLDRCSPENVTQVFEAIRVYLDAPGLVFVIGYDPDVVVNALHTAPGGTTSGHTYLEKIVQVDHVMPRPTAEQAGELARMCARHCGVAHLLGDAELTLIAERGQCNPRRIKRFLNTFVLARQLDPNADRLGPDEHIKLLLLRLHFPAFFQLMINKPEQDVVRLLLELSRFRGAVLAQREPDAAQVAWLRESSGLAGADPQALLAGLERHLDPLIVDLSRDRDLFTLLWSLGDDTQRADLLNRLRDPAALRAVESSAVESPAERPQPTDLNCDHATADRSVDEFCPRCGLFLEWASDNS